MDGLVCSHSPPPSPSCDDLAFPNYSLESYRDMAGLPPPVGTVAVAPTAAGFFHHNFLDSCFLCDKPLTGNSDIFMYRGDTPFCSEDCREQQIEIDEANEEKKKKKKTLKHQLSIKQKEKQQMSSPSKSQKIHIGAPSTAVAG